MKLNLYMDSIFFLDVFQNGLWWWPVSMALTALAFYVLKLLLKKEKQLEESEFNVWRNGLKASGIVVDVSFDQCELKSNKYREEVIKEPSAMDKYMAMDALVGHDNTTYKHVDQSVLVFKTELNGLMVTFVSPLINKDQSTLQFKLADKKTTQIYVDRYDRKNYYFDLEFLWN